MERILNATLSKAEFDKLSKFIMSEYGIKMPPEKKVMLQSRLQKRLKALNMSNFKEYVDYVFSPSGQSEEVIHMMDVVSTNKTDFFREAVHFDYMLTDALPSIQQKFSDHTVQIWSAGCSSGEEPYTLAITMEEYIEKHPNIGYNIMASDISTKMLKKGQMGIYPMERVNDIPLSIKKKYFLKSKNQEDPKVRLIPKLRSKISFGRINLLELTPSRSPKYHIVFCRNVLIYFDRPTQFNIISNLCSDLKPGGYLFLGHSESITGFELPLKSLIPTVFVKE